MRHRYLALFSALAIVGAWPASAHHSWAEEFDTSKPVTLEGTVTRIDWENPHVHYYVDAAGPDGTLRNWSCETGGPSRLARKGWTHDSLKVGDKIIVHGYLAKDGAHAVDGREVTLADGRKIGLESSH